MTTTNLFTTSSAVKKGELSGEKESKLIPRREEKMNRKKKCSNTPRALGVEKPFTLLVTTRNTNPSVSRFSFTRSIKSKD